MWRAFESSKEPFTFIGTFVQWKVSMDDTFFINALFLSAILNNFFSVFITEHFLKNTYLRSRLTLPFGTAFMLETHIWCLKIQLCRQLTRRCNRAYVSCSLRVNEHSYPDASRHRHTWTLSSETWHGEADDRKIWHQAGIHKMLSPNVWP